MENMNLKAKRDWKTPWESKRTGNSLMGLLNLFYPVFFIITRISYIWYGERIAMYL